MACVKHDGSLTILARNLLEAIGGGADEHLLAQQLNLPLYRVRAIVREMAGYGYVDSNTESVILTESGRERLEFIKPQDA